jgi:hypothetical protein
MVNTGGQLFTIEGIAAALIMLLTAYIVVNTTSVYTPGDTHINDMQLEVIGSDALRMMATPVDGLSKSPLELAVEDNNGAAFSAAFNNILNNRTGAKTDTVQFMANVSYVNSSLMSVNTTPLSMSRPLWGGEHAVHVSQWIIAEDLNYPDCVTYCKGKHAALVEVLLWRD